MIGKILGHYEILGLLGAGGMGEVYRARDTHLDRDVAIKVLPEDFAADPARLARFEREAKLLASLSHPNIAGIYGFEEADEVRFIAMECVEGATLAEKIEVEGRIEVDEALEIARQIAEALEAAHEAGIIHRDLKPANVKVTPDGQVKVLDFGLAKAYEADGSPAGTSPDLSHSPTMAAATRTGVILGTAAYMSPEQARGKPVDKRADIWAFGVVLFEMLAGRRPFEGETVSDTMASILKEEPDWEAVPATVPAGIRRLLERCLQKDPRQRLRDIGDARLEMSGPSEAASVADSASFASGSLRAWQRPGPLLAGGLALVVGSSLVVWGLMGGRIQTSAAPEAELVRRVDVNLPPEFPLVFVGEATAAVGQTALDLSPDGRLLVYVGPAGDTTRLYVRDMREGTVSPLEGTEGAYRPFFSPDGRWVAFFVGQQLMRVSVESGQVLPIVEANWALGADWSEDDLIVVSVNDGRRLAIVSPASRDVRFLDPSGDEFIFYTPQWLPGTEWILMGCDLPRHVCAMSSRTGELRSIAADANADGEGESKRLTGQDPRFVAPGHLIYSSPEGVLMGVRFDASTLRTLGDPEPLLRDLRRENVTGALHLSMASSGDLILAEGRDVGLATFAWATGTSVEPLPIEPRVYDAFSLSPTGRQIAALVKAGAGAGEVWFLDTVAGASVRWVPHGLVGEAGAEPGPWIPGTDQLFIHANDWRLLLRVDAGRGAGGELLWEGTGFLAVEDVAADGSLLVFAGSPGSRPGFLSLIDADEIENLPSDPTAVLAPLVESSGIQWGGKLHPDMTWLAYISDERGPYDVFAVRLPYDGGNVYQISEGGGGSPRWHPNGEGLYYRFGQEHYWVPLDDSAEDPFGPAEFVVQGNFLTVMQEEYDLSPDGSRLLVLESTGARTVSTLTLLTNWRSELERRLPLDDWR